jgi:uncharacterized RDD family membrane protein YckC
VHHVIQQPFVKSQFRGTEAECLHQAVVDAGRAAQNGYAPVSQAWAGSGNDRELTVVYEFRALVTADQPLLMAAAPGSNGPAPGWGYAGFWRRFGAYFLDALILAIPIYFLVFAVFGGEIRSIASRLTESSFTIDQVTGQITAITPDAAAAIRELLGLYVVVAALGLAINALYFTICWWRFGRTVGQRALGIDIRRDTDGTRIGFWRACLRYLGFILSSSVLGIGLIWAAFDSRKQGWHDKIAGTVVIHRTG